MFDLDDYGRVFLLMTIYAAVLACFTGLGWICCRIDTRIRAKRNKRRQGAQIEPDWQRRFDRRVEQHAELGKQMMINKKAVKVRDDLPTLKRCKECGMTITGEPGHLCGDCYRSILR